MHRLSSIIILLAWWQSTMLTAQSPHGKGFALDCAQCHSPESWGFNSKTATFDHNKTAFALEGQHQDLECRSCHTSMEFKKVGNTCVSCHTDMHNHTVGNDCARCHTAQSWVVENITLLHEKTLFPLIGAHATVDCKQCHQAETNIRFNPIGLECIDCHNNDFQNAKKPDHIKNGFSMDCASCHSPLTSEWNTTTVDHQFFPLEQGHDIKDCAACHKSSDYSLISADCYSCHKTDFVSTTIPNHVQLGFGTDCKQCHTIAPSWKPVDFKSHDAQFFPIYSGKHQGQWSQCTDCHSNASDYSQFTCTNCHTNPTTDNEHSTVTGYQYADNACLACHPTGDASAAFNHDATAFPLTGAHRMVDCKQCHTSGYQGTPKHCVSCHTNDYTSAINPDHKKLNLSTDCTTCHTTAPGWQPAQFSMHNDIYTLNGAHAIIANDCAACHTNGNFNSTPTSCIGCHNDEYNATIDPDHKANQFSTDCVSCHDESKWQPSTFNHDGLYFPIYSGKHKGTWMQCNECHDKPGQLSQFTCITCHQNPETNDQHNSVSGYQYESNACLACHPTGDANNSFNHNATNFPLTGVHSNLDCKQCHANGFEGTSTACVDCHKADFEASINPNHKALNFSNDCIQCHNTNNIDWSPATFTIHNQYYVLNGAHAMIANDCAACHNGSYNNTPNTCNQCHNDDYLATTNPNHKSAQFPTDCASCHSENGWQPSTFNHDGQYFPIYSGKHKGQWMECVDCHSNPANYAQVVCTTCHMNPETNNDHDGVGGYVYTDDACLACHPTGDADVIFDHNSTGFALTGGHQNVDCLQCHSSGFSNTSSNCVDCHLVDYNQSVNPNHATLNIPQDCASCHTTAPGWAPATFAIHNQYYALNGAHVAVANDCATCHNGSYTNTPNTCNGCHNEQYIATTNPNHISAQFPTDCISCHNENNWSPSTFNHDGQYFPIYSGSHLGQWNQCIDCHSNATNYAQVVCTTCHVNPETNEAHLTVGGYVYSSPACLACHPNGEADPSSFNHNNTAFPLANAHANLDCIQCHANGYQGTSTLCVDCHMTNFNTSTNPNHVSLGLSTDCASCHTTLPGWAPATFAVHNNYFALTGAHTTVSCIDCHIGGNYNNTPTDCNGCHNNDYTTAINPNHVALGLSTDCASCHTTAPGWAPATFAVHNNYFALTGAHTTVSCVDCHIGGNYNNTPTDCNGCHNGDYTATINPNHVSLGISTDCASCHTTAPGWSPATFAIHNTYYPLTGAHTTVNCIDCHIGGNYSSTPTDCNGCHNGDYTATSNPNHVSLGLSTDCASCHTTASGWSPAAFTVHNTYYPLTGAHATVNCNDCHIGGIYTNTPTDCNGCHNADFTAATNPNHVALGLSTNCVSCHTTAPGWAPATFSIHNTYYPLTGAHTTVDCNDCHIGGNYTNTPTDCNGCHNDDFSAATNPNHVALGLSTNCVSCHTTAPGWAPATFAIHNSIYPLTGAHTSVDCIECHVGGNYNNTPTDCNGCHNGDYTTATNPNHVSLGLSTNCVSCHTTSPGWAPATFAVHNTIYPLTGAHTTVDCIDCHIGGNYSNTPTDCNGCHNNNYTSTANPNHSAIGISTDCVSCHTTDPNWMPALFPIHNNYYVIEGAHTALSCNQCHTNGIYSGTPNTCIGCHQSEFNSTTNPNHVSAGFPTNCTTCHNQNAWTPSTWDHDDMYFPIYSGKHKDEWNNCNECHTTPNNYMLFNCLNCHQATQTNNDHNGVSGYQYNSNACYACHPNGES